MFKFWESLLGITAFSATLVSLVLLAVLPVAWGFRDGFVVGPDTPVSSGFEAEEKTFWCFNWGAAFSVSLVITSIFLLSFCFGCSATRRK